MCALTERCRNSRFKYICFDKMLCMSYVNLHSKVKLAGPVLMCVDQLFTEPWGSFQLCQIDCCFQAPGSEIRCGMEDTWGRSHTVDGLSRTSGSGADTAACVGLCALNPPVSWG